MRRMISASEARSQVLDHVRPGEPVELTVGEALGLALARAVKADRDYPPFDRASMDGFAVRLAHAGRTLVVRGESRPGVVPPTGPDDDCCVEIMTGAPCPSGTEAVVMREQVRRDDQQVELPLDIGLGQNIVRTGTECRSGSVVLPEGALLTPIALGLLATVGRSRVWVRRPPSLALLVTGDELVQNGQEPGGVDVRDSNGPMLAAMARGAGVEAARVAPVRDTTACVVGALEEVVSADVVVLTGGVSAGNYDRVPDALVDHGATIVFHKVRQQPGKPLLFAVKGRRLFFGLPGTPLGCHMSFHRYVLPALRGLAGRVALPVEERGELATPWLRTSDRQSFVPAKVTGHGGSFLVELLVPKGSSDLFTPWAANAYVDVPEGTRELCAGVEVAFEWLGVGS
jgi:molybdopterin molybdotransferase